MKAAAGQNREDFLAGISAALGRSGPAAVPSPPPMDEALVRRELPSTDLAARFAAQAAAAGMSVHQGSSADAPTVLSHLLHSLGVHRLTVDAGDSLQVDAALSSITGITAQGPASDRSAHFEADAGLTDVLAAVAETGSIIVSSAGRSRATPFVPPIHIALVAASQIVPDLMDLWECVHAANPAGLPAALMLVSGPSKTGDIEGIIITGVHGPREVHILLIDDRAKH